MKLILMRHAHALDGPDDDARPLSARGERQARQTVRGLTRLGIRLDHLLHSPKLRAVQTAQATTPLLREGADTAVHDGLATFPQRSILTHLSDREGTVAIVGHEPHLTELLTWLVAGEPSSERCVRLRKGGVAVIEGEPTPGGMHLLLLLSPTVLKRLR